MLLAMQSILVLSLLSIISAQQGLPKCGSFAAVSHLGSGPHGDRNADNLSPLLDNGGTASLHTSATDLGLSTHRCGASLISDRFLLTAAHCLESTERLVSINLGREDLNENPSPGPDTYKIQDIFIHSGYEPGKHEYNDIALIKTDRKVQFSDNVWPYCLPDSNQVFRNYLVVNIAGWGHVDHSHASSSLKTAFVNLIGKSDCESEWQKHASEVFDSIRLVTYPQGLTNQLLCGGRDGVDACQGDDGGPMTHVNSDGNRLLIGVIAKRNDCPDFPITPGFYINVAYYVDWINGITLSVPSNALPATPAGNSDGILP